MRDPRDQSSYPDQTEVAEVRRKLAIPYSIGNLCGVRANRAAGAADAVMRTGVRVVVLVCRASFCIAVQNASRFTGPTPATIALQKHPRRQLRAG